MRNFKLTIEYDGTAFNGWQTQSQGERTIQGEFTKVIFKVFKQKVTVIASGRTDAGVHALGQVVHFKVKTRMAPHEIQKALNSFLPPDIVVVAAEEASLDFHAQYSVKSKTYRYTILNRAYASALERNRCHFYPCSLNVSRMRREAEVLVGKKDFKSFEAAGHERGKHSTVRTVRRVDIHKKGDWVTIDIEANGFLYKMVRNIVGTLLEIGNGRLPLGSIKRILAQKDRCQAGQTAQPQGLCLVEVRY